MSNAFFFNSGKDSITRTSIARVNLSVSQYKQYGIRPFIDYFSKKNLYNFRFLYNYTYFNEYFYGIGNNLPASNKELYFFRLNQIDTRLTRQFFKNTYIGLQVNMQTMFDLDLKKPDGQLINNNIPGAKGNKTAGMGFVVAYDSRDKIYFPLNGAYIEVSQLFNDKLFGSEFDFSSLTIDARKYFHLKKYNVIAVQYFSKFNLGQAPFRQLAAIGNDMIMRGYYNGRYRDNLMYAFQGELRQTIWGPFGFVVFAGAGNVGSNSADLFNTIKPNAGLGIRGLALRKEHFNIRIDYGIGSGGNSGFYFTMGESF